MLRAEMIADRLLRTPPDLTGLMDRHRYCRLLGYDHDGHARTFRFDRIGELTYRQVAVRSDDVVLDGQVRYVRMRLVFGDKVTACPACGRKIRSGAAWWAHYSSAHARRPNWLNREDYIKLIGSPYEPPPELA